MNIKIYQDNKTTDEIDEGKSRINNIYENTQNTYKLEISLSKCEGVVLVDDVPSYTFWGDKSKYRTRVFVPINNLLLNNGKHIIKLQVFPKKGDLKFEKYAFGSVEAILYKDLTFNDQIKINSISTPSEDKKNLEGLPYYELNTELEVQLPFNIIGWTESVDLKKEMENGNDIKNEVKSAYDKIRQIIDKKDIIGFSELIKEREALLATAFYFTKDEEKKELEEFLDLIKNPDYELAPYPAEADLHFYGYGKLVTLFTKEREGVIKLINKKDPNEEIILDFYFHRKQKEEKLEVIL